ncbi:MAG: helix-turn-helix domain-containing protein, partial [Alphaproteobacteria bacterium]|nr:helix-turn-helix domain-containing protein [Alphaproteobacteria bacterium]
MAMTELDAGMTDRPAPLGSGYATIGRALAWLGRHWQENPSLDEVAAATGLAPHHFQRLFTRHVGVSPKKYVQYLTLRHAKRRLAESASVLDAAFDAGLSGPGRLHDLFVTHEALTPGEWKARGADLRLAWGWHDSPFGDCLIVASPRGVCGLAFGERDDHDVVLADLATNFGEARLVSDAAATRSFAERAFGDGGTI